MIPFTSFGHRRHHDHHHRRHGYHRRRHGYRRRHQSRRYYGRRHRQNLPCWKNRGYCSNERRRH